MPRELVLSLDGREFSVVLKKIDREKLYGDVEIEAFDEKGNEATLMVLAADGSTLIDKGGTALTTVTEDGTSISRSELNAVDVNGDPIEPVPSSFGHPNVLKTAKTDDYLSQIIKSIYLLEPPVDSDLEYLKSHLSGEQIYNFDFSYRGGLEFDSAFIVGGDGEAFMTIGKQAQFQFVKLNQAVVMEAVEDNEVSADDLDFDLL